MTSPSLAQIALWSAIVVEGHVWESKDVREAKAYVVESNGAAKESFVRGEMPVPGHAVHSPLALEAVPQGMAVLSSILKDHDRRDMSTPEYFAASTHLGELTPSDFAVSLRATDEPAVLDTGIAKAVYLSGLFAMGGLVCWMYFERGLRVIISVLCYMFSLSSMTLTIRNVYVNFNFNHPLWLTASHFLFTALIGLCILFHQHRTGEQPMTIPPLRQFARGILPVSLVFAISIGSANLGLLYTNAHFYEMVGATTALATAGLGVLMGKTFDPVLLPPLLFVTSGLMICAFGEIVFSSIGFSFCAAAVMSRALKAIVQHQLMEGDIGMRLTPIQLVVWMSLPSSGIMALWSLYSEGAQPFYDFYASAGTQGAVFLTIINACILNTAALYVLQNLGPVAQQLAGQLKGVLAILGSVALFGEQVALQQIFGFSIIIAGVTWYNRKDMWIKQQGQAAQSGTAAPQVASNVNSKAAETSPLLEHQRS